MPFETELKRQLIQIKDADDKRISEFRNIREKDLVGRSDHFIAEGKVVLQHLINTAHGSRFALKKVLILQNRLEGLLPILQSLPDEAELYVADRDVIDAIAGFPMHRGILALGEYQNGASGRWRDDIKSEQLILAACGIANHDNLGSLFRNAAAFGVDRILLDKTCCNPLYRKSIRVSVGSVLTVPFELDLTADEIISSLSDAKYSCYGFSPQGDLTLGSAEPPHKAALIVGAEGEGLPEHVLANIKTIRIEQSDRLDSLNVGTASGIALWQFATKMGRI